MTNLHFEDDILLTGRSIPQIRQIMADIFAEGSKVCFQLHPAKTKFMHSCIGYESGVRSAKIDGMNIDLLGVDGSAKYLGRALTLTDTHDTELAHRIKKAWAKFELTDRS